ncbi:TRM11 family SAM-dependent methyltransferase [Paenibacillus silviterrae]|uniref:TRM11 family SAM-dependent methyltransferase n=1 Tax=Paenibacillus silviterrae TaxID=3242194 RepID=UPI002543450B|nr:methyltransferase domain-containing protein [Paenibacillus chinjuensis]
MSYLYTFACHEDEEELCRLELKSLLGQEPPVASEGRYIWSARCLDPSRSPFVKVRMHARLEAASLAELCEQAQGLELEGSTFKVVFLETDKPYPDYQEQRSIERKLGAHIRGKAEMRTPERVYSVACIKGRWLLGESESQKAVWLRHVDKPQQYSTALSTRVARAVVNIAVPEPRGVRTIDPCCGIGTVLIEALSMGIEMVGYDINPLAIRGARVNLEYFGFPNVVKLADMTSLGPETYDAAVLDMPYNLCSKLPTEEQKKMLGSVRKLAPRVVILTIEEIDEALSASGLRILERCSIRKGSFSRQLLVCQS